MIVRIGSSLPPALIDANQVELAILNLVINARDAMPEGGEIQISVDLEERALSAGPRSADYLLVEVSDTGSGMDAATLGKAINPFFSTKPLGKGTGLGLSMVHGLAVQLGGSLELASEPGKGTVASLRLPIANIPVVTISPQREPNIVARSATILVVDDDFLIAMSTASMLEDLGHRVIEANSGEKAIEILDGGETIDMMITDHAMPKMTGVELSNVARRLRPAMPILLATGYADLPAGYTSDVPRLSKPYNQTQLAGAVNKLLDLSRGAA